jgi:acyl-homoserine-lactone acylase
MIMRAFFITVLLFTFQYPSYSQSLESLAQQVSIRRTEYGVPHIKGETLKSAAFGLAWCELEDYGERVIRPLIAARGDLALVDGYASIENDYMRQLSYQRTLQTYHQLDVRTRELLEGFARGVNYYLQKNPDKFPHYRGWKFTGSDVAAVTTSIASANGYGNFVERLKQQKAKRDSLKLTEAGSNAWAFAPSRTKEGHAILVRNPHLSWDAGYYEAQLTVEDTLNFYGDFRVGGLFAIIGGFNQHLGWATTNNYPDLEEIYALQADTTRADHFLMDGVSVPLERKLVTAEFKNGNAMATETREFFFTPYGPVIHRDEGKIYIAREAGDGEYRRGEQFTRMMLATNLEEWKDAMRMQAITSSNYTYADADGNIFYVWNATQPILSHPATYDSLVTEVQASSQLWNDYVPFDELPQLLNPPGGYLHNENDPFHFTNLNAVLQPEDFADNFPQPRLRQRSQHSLGLIHNDDVLSLEEVVKRKHSMRMLLADQLKDDLLEALDATAPESEIREAMEFLQAWDNTVQADSRGGVLFAEWFTHYAEAMQERELYAIPWSFDQPMETPDGLADPTQAVASFREVIKSLQDQYGSWDMPWGEVHRLRLGNLDLPVGGGPGGLGCFRVLWFTDAEDGKRKIRGGDGWQLAVQFSDPPRAYSILAYGQTNDPDSPHHTDQAQLFADNEMKAVAYTEKDIRKKLLRSYHPGE